MNMPSLHQGALFRALAALEDVDLHVIFAKDLTPDRLELGWHDDLAGFSCQFLDERNRMADAIRLARLQRERFHIINGLWTEQAFAAALVTLAMLRSRYAIYSEAPDPDASRSIFKRLLQRVFGKSLAPKAAGALSISRFATQFYKSLNVRDRRIYPFGYFRTARSADGLIHLRNDNRIEIIFVGQLIHRKGIDILLEALQPLFKQYSNLFLVLIGGGEGLDSIQQHASALGLTDRLIIEGIMASDKIQARVAAADLLVLPSRWDGWGIVVNEALSVGVPAIASDRCGAADIIRNGVNGYVFRSEDVSDLRNCLSDFLSRQSEWPDFRANAVATGNDVSVEAAAPYLIDCVKHMMGTLGERPVPPWATTCLNENTLSR
jgi:glycosyltransferase involved in cell wall biosynthesis